MQKIKANAASRQFMLRLMAATLILVIIITSIIIDRTSSAAFQLPKAQSSAGLVLAKSESASGKKSWISADQTGRQVLYTGVLKNKKELWFVKNGKADASYTGLASNDDGSYYVKNGKVDTSYNGLVSSDGFWWKIDNGAVNYNYNGIAEHDGKEWFVENGRVSRFYTGTYKTKYKKYEIVRGLVERCTDIPQNETDKLISSDTLLKTAAAYLGTPYCMGAKGWNGIGSANPTKIAHPSGLDCSGFVYTTLMDLGVRTAGFAVNSHTPVNTYDWVGSDPSMSYNGYSTYINKFYSHSGNASSWYTYSSNGSTKRLTPGTVIIGNGSTEHAWIYFGNFATKEDVINYLVNDLGCSRSAVEPYVLSVNSGNTDWKMEAVLSTSGALKSCVNINNASLIPGMYNDLTAFKITK